jgi:jumonji domain-containing protein 7
MGDMEDSAFQQWIELSDSMRDFCVPTTVPRILRPSPEEFYREYVAPAKPCIITDFSLDWKAMDEWSIPCLEKRLGDSLLTVNVTPDGRADAVKDGKFVMAEERKMTFGEFMNEARDTSSNQSVYLSYQNNNMREQAGVLMEDVTVGDEWSQNVFGEPEAVNLWVGDHKNVSSPHMDFFENIYSVIRGQKIFTLMPPTDMWCVYKTMYPAYRHKYSKADGWSVERVEDDLSTPWIPIDPNEPDFDKYPRFSHATCLRVTVREGETLYLPSMWYHQVEQQGGPEGMTIAVNQWFDMVHNFRYVALKFMESSMKMQLGDQFYM